MNCTLQVICTFFLWQVRGGYYSAVPAACSGVCSSSVKHPELGFLEVDGFREIARKRQLFGNGAEKCLYTMADSKTVQPCCNFRARECSAGKPFALGGVRHESVFEKRMREIRTVRARQRRMKHPSVAQDSTTEYSTLDEDPAQPPLSQPLLGSLKPTSPEEVRFCNVDCQHYLGALNFEIFHFCRLY